jgi:small subunit ribosomal protein S4e
MVTGKTTIKGGVTQLHLHDGRNILLDSTSKYNTGDSIVISLPDQKIQTHLPMEKDSLAYLIGGNHIGETAKITDFSIKRSSKPNETSFEDFLTVSEYVFIIGNESDLPLEGE